MPDPTTPYAGLTKPTVGADDNLWGGLLNADLDLIDTFLRNIVPAGVMFEFAGAAAPTGFLLCDGSAISRTTYAALFAAIGTTWGAGDGSTTFNIPDRRGRFGIGANGTYALASTGGAASFTPTITVASHTLTLAEIPSHNHSATDSGHTHIASDAGHSHVATDSGHVHVQDFNTYYNASGLQLSLGSGVNLTAPGGVTTAAASANITVATGNAAITVNSSTANVTVGFNGGSGGHTHNATSNAVPTVPPYVAVNYIIKT